MNRREVFRWGAVAAAALGGAGLRPGGLRAQAAGGEPPGPWSLGGQIPRCADASKNIREIAIDELSIDLRETTTGTDVEYRLYGPGQAHWGSAKFTSAVTLGGSKELQAWFNEAAKGKNIRKNITVTLFKSDKTPGRSYTLMDCFPTQWSAVNFDTSSTVQTETLTVKIGRIEFAT